MQFILGVYGDRSLSLGVYQLCVILVIAGSSGYDEKTCFRREHFDSHYETSNVVNAPDA
jgi:hypothetical protein